MTWMTENLHRHISPKFKSQQFTHHLILSFPYVPSISIILPKYYPLLLFQRNTTGCHCHSHGNKCSKWKKKFGSMGAGTLIWQNTKLKTSEGRQTQLKCEVQMRTEEEKMKTKKKKREKKPFISCFAKMNFKAHLLRVMLLFAAKKPPINTDSAVRGQQANIVRYVDTNRESGW